MSVPRTAPLAKGRRRPPLKMNHGILRLMRQALTAAQHGPAGGLDERTRRWLDTWVVAPLREAVAAAQDTKKPDE